MDRISIIIPTRERQDTLKYTIKTCTTQEDDHLSIIVSDNFSNDATKSVVSSFNDKRIKYVNPGKRLSMSHNWEFALSHVSDGYVIFLGDDDGLLPNSIKKIRTIIRSKKMKAIAWAQASYAWPTHINSNARNQLLVPLSKHFEVRSSAKYLYDVARFKASYLELPGLYKGLIHYDLIEQARSKNGIFFNSSLPDLYSAVAISKIVKEYYYSYEPFTINGASHHSGGTSYFSNSGEEKSKVSAEIFLKEDNIPFHSKLVLAPSLPLLIAESFLQANEHLHRTDKTHIDFKSMLLEAIEDAIPKENTKYDAVIAAVRDIAQLNKIDLQYIDEIILRSKNVTNSQYKPNFGFDPLHTNIRLDCNELNISNVYDASIAIGCILKLEEFKNLSSIASKRRSIGQILRSILQCLSCCPNKRL